MSSPTLRSRVAALAQPVERLPLRREIVMTLLILAESTIVFIYGGTLLAGHEHPFEPLPILLIFATLLIAYQIPHLLETIRVWSPEYEVVMGIGLTATTLMVIKVGAFPDAAIASTGWIDDLSQAMILRESDAVRPVWPLIVFVAYAWARGRTRAEPVLETAYGMLRFGMIWTVAGLLLNVMAMPSDAAIMHRITPAVAGFVVTSLLAVALSRNQSTHRTSETRPVWTWVVVVLLPILVISAATISVAGILTREMFDLVFTALSPLFWLIALIVQILILLIALIAFIVIAPIIWILERQGIVNMSEFPSLDLTPGAPGSVDEMAQSTLGVADPIRYLVAGLFLGGLAWALVRFAFRRRRRWEPGQRQQRESLIEWQAEPMTLLRRARSWLGGRRRSSAGDPYPDDPEWNGTRRVRRVYRDFLRTSRRNEIAREPHDTPDQFAHRLVLLHADLRPEIQQITISYNQARYSGRPVDGETADRAEHAQRLFEQGISANEPS